MIIYCVLNNILIKYEVVYTFLPHDMDSKI
jgi:hypothetical protein